MGTVEDLLDPKDREALLRLKTRLARTRRRPRKEQVVLVDPAILGDYPEAVQRARPEPSPSG
jgi:ribosome-binding protein aMBF1 (putative translation factor)